MFCPECRSEWDPREAVKPAPVPTTHAALVAAEAGTIRGPDLLGSYDTIVEVTHDDGGSGNVRTDRYVYHSETPHTMQDALDMAVEHFSVAVMSHVEEAKVVERIPDLEALSEMTGQDEVKLQGANVPDVEPDVDHGDEVDEPGPVDVPSEQDDILAAAYLETLTGTGVTLEGGQRATLLDFPDDDHARVQLADGLVSVVDFNDIIGADPQTVEAETPDVELDDETAGMFGGAALILACLVIEAGIASIEGEGEAATLVEPPSGWFPPDEDAVPLMEQAAAGAVSMLIQTFALPRAELQAMVAKVREGVTASDDGARPE
jgi:hypothetical protein